jgi:hypothetical protein
MMTEEIVDSGSPNACKICGEAIPGKGFHRYCSKQECVDERSNRLRTKKRISARKHYDGGKTGPAATMPLLPPEEKLHELSFTMQKVMKEAELNMKKNGIDTTLRFLNTVIEQTDEIAYTLWNEGSPMAAVRRIEQCDTLEIVFRTMSAAYDGSTRPWPRRFATWMRNIKCRADLTKGRNRSEDINIRLIPSDELFITGADENTAPPASSSDIHEAMMVGSEE